jgi:nucleoid-associated protein YgaU
MTKETKIGLLVGLAFIILFAIILSEKSGTNRDTALPAFAVADAARKGRPSTGAERPLYDAGRVPVESKLQPPGGSQAGASESSSSVNSAVAQKPPEGEGHAPKSESLTQLLNPSEEESPAKADQVKAKEGPSVTLGEAVAIALESTPPPVVPKPEKNLESQESVRGASAQAESVAEGTAAEDSQGTPSRSSTRSAEPPPIRATHEVQPGESLGKIAAKYYGRSTPQRIEAIFNANREVLANVNAVKASTKLNIPDLGDKGDQFEPAPTFVGTQLAAGARTHGRQEQAGISPPIGDRTQPSPKQRGSTPMSRAASAAEEKVKGDKDKSPDKRKGEKAAEPKFEWYEVKQTDTLTKIAEKKLGDQKLFNEILRANRDRIPNKDVLKSGLKIRIPVKLTSSFPLEGTVSSRGPDDAEP